MKKAILAVAVMALVGGSFTSCKKGENDPFLSLKSRKGRITGEWKKTAGETTMTNSGSFASTTTTTFTETGYTQVTSAGGASNTDVYDFTKTMTIEKDGTYEIVETETQVSSGGVAIDPAFQSTSTTTISGNWQFLKKSKEAELKNKEAVAMTPTSVTTSVVAGGTTTSGTETATGYFAVTAMAIDQLKNKEMIVLADESYSDGTNTSTTTGTFTFEKQ